MSGIIDELTEGDEAKRQEILEALKKMAKALTLPIEDHSSIGPENPSGNTRIGAYMFSQAATACFGRYRDYFGIMWDPKGVQVHPMINQAMEEVDRLVAEFTNNRDQETRRGIQLFFYSELGNIMLGKARKYSPALWTNMELGLLQELVDWV